MSIDFVPPERDPNASELRAAYETAAAMSAKAFGRLLDNIEQHSRYNEKAVEGRKIIAEIDNSAARAAALTSELATLVAAFDDWRGRAAALLEAMAAVPERVTALVERDTPHPASVMGRPVVK